MYSTKSILRNVREVLSTETNGKPIKRKLFEKSPKHKMSSRTLVRRFGSWKKTMKRAINIGSSN
jgi:hypothetical protein